MNSECEKAKRYDVENGLLRRTGMPGVPQSMGLHRVGHDCVSEQQQQPLEMRVIATAHGA